MQSVTRLKIGILLGVLVAAAAILAMLLPGLLDAGRLGKQLTARLTIWSGGEVTIAGPTRVSYFPGLVLEADGVHIAGPGNLPQVREIRSKTLRIEINPWSAVFGSADIKRLVLIEPRVTLADGPAGAQTPSSFLTTLQAAPLSRLGLVDAAVSVGATRAPAVIDNINAEFDLTADGSVSGHGRFAWRGEGLTYSFDTGEPVVQGDAVKAALNLSVSSSLVSASFKGEAALAGGPQVHGTLDMTLPRLRAFAAWLGMPVPKGRGLNELKAAGALRWQEGRLAFDQGTFSLDGNAAQGVLAIDFAGARPALSGTLALQQFALSPYLPPASAAPDAADAPAADFDPALLQLVDLDLRVSTAEVLAPALPLGQTALSIRLSDGALAADFSVLALCGGNADGRIEIDASGYTPRLRLAGTAAGLATKPCLEAVFPMPSPIEGTSSLTFDLTASGHTVSQLRASLDGSASLAMSAGQAAIDFVKLFTQAKRRELRGWESVRGSPTSFDTLTGKCVFNRGLAHCTSLKVATGVADVAGGGSLDMLTGALDWRLNVTSKADGPLRHVGRLVSGLLDDVVVGGSWTDPTFRLPNADSSGSAEPLRRFAFQRQQF